MTLSPRLDGNIVPSDNVFRTAESIEPPHAPTAHRLAGGGGEREKGEYIFLAPLILRPMSSAADNDRRRGGEDVPQRRRLKYRKAGRRFGNPAVTCAASWLD